MFSSKKRKTTTAEEDDGGLPTGSPSPMLGDTPKRGKRIMKAQRPSMGGPQNTEFIRLKNALYQKTVQDIMESGPFQPLFGSMGPRLPTTLKDGHPTFVNESLTDLRWALASLKDLYCRPSGDVIAMGQEDVGQLGLVKLINKEKDNGFPPTLLQELRGKGFNQVACGGMHSVGVTQDGTAYTWGSNDEGQLGREDFAEEFTTPPTAITRMVPSKYAVSKHTVRSTQNECNDVVAVSAGSSHTLFLTVSGNLYFAGSYKDNESGAFFCDQRPPDDKDGKDKDVKGSVLGQRIDPVHVYQLPGRAKMIASGGLFNGAILEDGELVTWGIGIMGELARNKNSTTKKDQYGLLDLGQNFYMRVEGGKKVFLEDVIKEHFLTPKPVQWALPGRKIVTHVACGSQHLLVAARAPEDSSSRLYVAGSGAHGRLGLGDENARYELTLVDDLKDVPISRVAAGIQHSIVLNAKGDTIYAAGSGGKGELGIPESQMEHKAAQQGGKEGEGHSTRFVRVAFPKTEKLDKIGRFVDVFCGEAHSGAITSAGKIYTWGYGEYGQCGNDPRISEKDIKQPRLNEDWLKDADLFVHQAAGGSQHSVIVATRYKKTT